MNNEKLCSRAGFEPETRNLFDRFLRATGAAKTVPMIFRRRFMKWSGFAVLLIVPAALLMIWTAVLLERSGINGFTRSLLRRIMDIFR